MIRERSIEPFLIVDSKNQESVNSKDNDDKDFELHLVYGQRPGFFHGCASVSGQGIRHTLDHFYVPT